MIFQARKAHLVRISINDRLLLKFYFTRVVTISLYMHRPIMIAIELSQDKVVDGCCYLMYKVKITQKAFYKEKNASQCRQLTLLHWNTSPSSNSKERTPTGSSWIERPQNLLFRLLSPQNFQPRPSQWHATIVGWWLTYTIINKSLFKIRE